ncbi:EcsC family protein [Actinotalea sp. JY-7876]|uniref:EcsC family protein n=1 Tax=Actinotalea sp. JY-7876 TaxID=2758442 RepID=UPI0015F63D2D|nr:EcsC family protein [Actinotalea sp. JY-7876]
MLERGAVRSRRRPFVPPAPPAALAGSTPDHADRGLLAPAPPGRPTRRTGRTGHHGRRRSETSRDPYEQARWEKLNAHWAARDNARGLPNWLNDFTDAATQQAGKVVRAVGDALPEPVRDGIAKTGGFVLDRTLQPTAHAVIELLRLVDAWAVELTDPETVVAIAHKHGLNIDTFMALRTVELRDCERLLTRNTLKWRTTGALEGGAMGALALVPVAGIPLSIGLDVIVIQVLTTAIASRIAYSYGFDVQDPDERAFVDRLVARTFLKQAAKAKPVKDTARAAQATFGRQNWSAKLRGDHELVAALEKFMARWYQGGKVPVSLNRPGFHGGSQPTEDESHGSTEEVPRRAPRAGDQDGGRRAS